LEILTSFFGSCPSSQTKTKFESAIFNPKVKVTEKRRMSALIKVHPGDTVGCLNPENFIMEGGTQANH
jgi:hypothetical protein